MSHNIYDEQKIYAYRKLISLLDRGSVNFYDNHFLDTKLFSELGIYEKNPIFILFGLNEFWEDDIRDGYLTIKLQTEKGNKIREGIDYLTSLYKQTSLQNSHGLPLPLIDPDINIIDDFPDHVDQQESDDAELIQRYLLLLVNIYELDLQNAIYNSGLIIEVKKGDRFSNILKLGSFATNVNILYRNFNRADFGNEGNFLLSFKKQLELARELIKSKFATHEINDIIITPQVALKDRGKHTESTEYIFDAKVRLLDCIFYLEYKDEIRVLDLMPHRVILDATNLSLEKIQKEEIYLNSILKLVPNGKNVDVMVKESDEKLCDFRNSDKNTRLKLFKAIAGKYPNPAKRTEVINRAGIEQGKTKDGQFYKNLYSTIRILSTVLKKQSKGKLSIDISKASETGYLLKITL